MSNNVIAFMNMKGGVGKTTLCVNLAYCLAKEFNKKVLVIDFDPQANASQYLIDEHAFEQLIKEKRTIYSLYDDIVQVYSSVIGEYEEETDISPDQLIYSIADNLFLITGNLALASISYGADSSTAFRLGDYITTHQLKEQYDFIFIDCPPTHSIYTTSALLIANYYIMPVKPDFLSSLGIDLFKRIINRNNRTSPNKVKCLGIVFTLVQNYPYCLDRMQRIREMNIFSVFENSIQQSTLVSRAAESHEFLYDISQFKDNIINLTQEFVRKLEGEA